MASRKQWMLVVHSVWLLPLVIDSMLLRSWLLPKLLVTRNRCLLLKSVASRSAVDTLRAWIQKNVPSTPETTHLWPHQQAGTDAAVQALEDDPAILAAFRQIFAAHHYDIQSAVPSRRSTRTPSFIRRTSTDPTGGCPAARSIGCWWE
jgi:hypothetical protein